ncbi:MAG: zinc ribbon domain-containing protein [Proteobacteria bacterium]|nr:zinc ribbon domain-containing protein [Pseudomonadota bacterium]
MPIYEFKCLKCEKFIELLLLSSDEKIELKCPDCNSEELERVLSTSSYSMGAGSGTGSKVGSQTRACSGGSCTTWDIPGHTR